MFFFNVVRFIINHILLNLNLNLIKYNTLSQTEQILINGFCVNCLLYLV